MIDTVIDSAIIITIVITLVGYTNGCTNFLVTPGASVSSSSMISYSADSHTLYGALYFFPSFESPSTIRIVDWDSGKYLGDIPNVPNPYHVVGYMNEHQLTIGESTFGGIEELQEPNENDILDYGNLIWITLQRAKTAREAILVIDGLISLYGYYSEGESISIADRHEVWYMEIIGKGKEEKGGVWVARKIPDGHVSAHANQARIRKFDHNDPDNCLYSADLIPFARRRGYLKNYQKDEEFSFADTFNPLTFEGARFGEARVWSFFRQISNGMDQYIDHITGQNLNNRLPLSVKPKQKLSEKDLFFYMRNHFEDTVLDMSKDVGSHPFNLPYRWRPLIWEYGDHQYVNERAIATQQTGFSFISQTRPQHIGKEFGITYFGVDDTSQSVYFPVYNSITKIPFAWSENSGSLRNFNFDSAFWIFNMLSHFVYLRYNLVYPEVRKRIEELEEIFISDSKRMEKEAMSVYASNKTRAVEILTNFSCSTGDFLFNEWKTYYGNLFKKYFDGDRRIWKEDKVFPDVKFDGYPTEFYGSIVKQTGEKFKVLETPYRDQKLSLIYVIITIFLIVFFFASFCFKL